MVYSLVSQIFTMKFLVRDLAGESRSMGGTYLCISWYEGPDLLVELQSRKQKETTGMRSDIIIT